MRKICISFVVVICLLVTMGTTVFTEGDSNKGKCNNIAIQTSFEEGESVQRANTQSESDQRLHDLLRTEEDIQYYAYLELGTADPEIVPVILKARDTIIFRQSWVADGVQGFVYDKNWNIIEEVPQFSELFPKDWSIPILSTEVDLSYYR